MRYEFLTDFPRRMSNVGLYAVLIQNITNKTNWNKYYINSSDEEINVVFSVLLFVMEKSLRDEYCTLDDIAVFLDELNNSYYKKPLGFDECRELGDFIVNTILSNDGRMMSFDGYDYDRSEMTTKSIRYVMNKAAYIDGAVKRISYSLTDDGYSLMLSTLEVESNLRFTIQEMVFQLHLERQSYDRAAQDIKELFNQIRIQLRKMEQAMTSIRRNALSFSVYEYEKILNENMDMIVDTKTKFEGYRDVVSQRRKELEELDLDDRRLGPEEEEKIIYLQIIYDYLGRTIDEHQKILSTHFDLKELYSKELESLSVVSLVKRFSLRTEVYDRVIQNPSMLENIHILTSPLLINDIDKIYNPLMAAYPQRLSRRSVDIDSTMDIDFDEEEWQREREKEKKDTYKKYMSCISFLIETAMKKETVKLSEIKEMILDDEKAKKRLIPTLGVFKEVMVELIKNRVLNIDELRKEKQMTFSDDEYSIEINRMILDVLDKKKNTQSIKYFVISKCADEPVDFDNIEVEPGHFVTARCSDVVFSLVMN